MNKPISAETMETAPSSQSDLSQQPDCTADLANAAMTDIQVPSLSEQSADKSRGQVMKEVVGPAMTDLLKSIYEQSFNEEEALILDSQKDFRETFNSYKRFTESVGTILFHRISFANRLSQEISELNEKRSNTFFHNHSSLILKEGVNTGVAVPLTLALQISEVESHLAQDWDPEKGYVSPYDPDKIIEIMQRESFDKILLQLTKGPNGFLGSGSDKFRERDGFFHFKYPYSSFRLTAEAAYKIKDGKVVGLSDNYHMSANKKRESLRDPAAHPKSSSGCPVRHRFEDESGEKQDSLVIIAKNFIIFALQEATKMQDQPE